MSCGVTTENARGDINGVSAHEDVVQRRPEPGHAGHGCFARRHFVRSGGAKKKCGDEQG